VPPVLRSSLSARASSDIVWYLLLPVAVLLVPIVSLPVVLGMLILIATSPQVALELILARDGLVLLLLYLFSFGPAYVYAFVYWMRGRASLPKAILLAHGFEVYSHLWLISGWTAVFRVARRKRGWDKTARVREPATTG
jgi:hypothetical protein